METISLIIFTATAIEIGIIAVHLLDKNKDVISHVFTGLAVSIALWTMSHGILHGLDVNIEYSVIKFLSAVNITDTKELASFLITFNYFMSVIIASLFFCFALIFFKNKALKTYIKASLVTLQIIFFPLFFCCEFIATNVTYVGGFQGWKWDYGSLWFVFAGFFLSFWIGGSYFLYRKQKISSETPRENLRNMFYATLGIMLINIINILLPQIGIHDFGWITPIAMVGWILLFFCFFIKFKQINAPLAFVKILLSTAGIILFINILVSGATKGIGVAFETIIKTLVFATFVSVGYLLITNIFKEAKRKKQVEELNRQLKTLNENLEDEVTDRTKELSEAKTHSETILENLTLGIVEYDKNFTILRVNKAAEQLLGIERHTILGTSVQPKDRENKKLSSLSMILYPALSEKGRKVSSREEFEKNISKNEVVINYPIKKDLQIITVPIKETHVTKTPRYVKLLRDITCEKIVTRSKNEFIKIAAHQLRTPLSGTKWALYTILDQDVGSISSEQKDLLQKTYDTNKSLIDIVNSLLNVARVEEENLGYEIKKYDMTETIKEVLRSSMLLMKEKKLKINFKKSTLDVPQALFDKTKIILALKNIVSNAIGYTPDGGKITVTLTQKENMAVITVIDTGIGISKEEQKHLFAKFYRGERAKKMEAGRPGLGLYITEEIIKKCNGTIKIESAENVGTTVTIKLPVARVLASNAS